MITLHSISGNLTYRFDYRKEGWGKGQKPPFTDYIIENNETIVVVVTRDLETRLF